MLTNVMANINETAVFGVIDSPIYMKVKIAKEIIPVAKPINLPGHNTPSKYPTTNLVAIINAYDIGTANIIATKSG